MTLLVRSRASDGPLVLSGVGVGGLFEQVHGVVVEVVEAAFGVAAWGVEEGALSFGENFRGLTCGDASRPRPPLVHGPDTASTVGW
ncbi:hypothetical protein ACWGDT_01550 [Streptomyces avermitilis]